MSTTGIPIITLRSPVYESMIFYSWHYSLNAFLKKLIPWNCWKATADWNIKVENTLKKEVS